MNHIRSSRDDTQTARFASRWDVFFSYSGPDRERARELVRALRAVPLTVFFDDEAIGPGQVWIDALEQGVLNARYFLILLSRNTNRAWAHTEANLALRRFHESNELNIVPLFADGLERNTDFGFLTGFHGWQLPADQAQWSEFIQERGGALALAPLPPASNAPALFEEGETYPSPYPGLFSFDEDQAHFFFGRSLEVRQCLDALQRRRWLHIDGPSGSGKSSLVKAGLIPALRLQQVSKVEGWAVAIVRPQVQPLESLAVAIKEVTREAGGADTASLLQRLESDHRSLRLILATHFEATRTGIILFIDQLEEPLAFARDRRMLLHFDAIIAEALAAASPFILLSAIRSDYMNRFESLPRMSSCLNALAARYYLNPMAAGLEQAVTGPAKLTGVDLQHGLVQRLLDDTQAKEGGLPLLAHVLRRLWISRKGTYIEHDLYDKLGGLAGALSKDADGVIHGMTKDEQETARRILVSLVRLDQASTDTKRPVSRDEIIRAAGNGSETERVLLELSGGGMKDPGLRLVTVGRIGSDPAPFVDLAHEALIKNWKMLSDWLEADRRVLERREDLRAAARSWNAENRPAVGGDGKTIASADADGHLILWDVASRSERTSTSVVGEDFVDLAFLGNDKRLLSVSTEGRIRLWRVADGTPITAKETGCKSSKVALQEGRGALAIGCDGGRVDLFDLEGLTHQGSVQFGTDRITTVKFRGKSLDLAVGAADGSVWYANEGEHTGNVLYRHELGGLAARVGRAVLGVVALTISPEGDYMASSGDSPDIKVFSFKQNAVVRVLKGHESWVPGLTFGDSWIRLFSGSHDTTLRVWDVPSGKTILTLRGHAYQVLCLGYNSAHKLLVSGSSDRTVRVW